MLLGTLTLPHVVRAAMAQAGRPMLVFVGNEL